MAYLRTYLNEICTVYGEVRVKYGELQDKISEIAEKRNGVLRDRDLTSAGRQKRLYKFDAERSALLEELHALNDEVTKRFADIRNQTKTAFYNVYTATSEDVDMGAIELLKSGVLRDSELVELADHFKGNCAMRRIIGKYAGERAERDRSNIEMRELSAKLNSYAMPHLEAVDALTEVAMMGLRDDRKLSDNMHNQMFDKTVNTLLAQYGDICTE